MNTDNKEQAPVKDRSTHYAELAAQRFEECVQHLETIEQLQQRIVQLEQREKEIASDAWDAGANAHSNYGFGALKEWKAQYLSKFEQTKTGNI